MDRFHEAAGVFITKRLFQMLGQPVAEEEKDEYSYFDIIKWPWALNSDFEIEIEKFRAFSTIFAQKFVIWQEI